jgi:uncharacterized protein GlcG (DUF336 family)
MKGAVEMIKPAKWMRVTAAAAVVVIGWSMASWAQQAKPPADCSKLPNHDTLRGALQSVIKEGKTANSGMGNQEWAVIVNRDGVVCAVVFSGPDRGTQWPGSRLIAAEKANTANALSVDNFAISTANLWFASQPGQSLYSLTTSAPPNPQAVFSGSPQQYGENNDPFVGKAIGGIIVFGGGLALYDGSGKIVGGLGVSGDTSCADHVVAWKMRHNLKFDAIPVGPTPTADDNMLLDVGGDGKSASGWGHPTCKGGQPPEDIIKNLKNKYPVGKR